MGDRAFILSRPVPVGESAQALISVGPLSDPHRVEKWIWYRSKQ